MNRKLLYMLINGSEWEDFVIIDCEEEALQASILQPNCRVEIFSIFDNKIGYYPTYNYYKNGVYYESS